MMRLLTAVCAVALSLQPAFAALRAPVRVHTAPVGGTSAAAAGSALGQTTLAAPLSAVDTLSAEPTLADLSAVSAQPQVRTPAAAAVSRVDAVLNPQAEAAPQPRLAAHQTLQAVAKAAPKAAKGDAAPSARMAMAYDGGAKTGQISAPAVAGVSAQAPTHMAGLRHTGGLADDEPNPGERAAAAGKDVAAPKAEVKREVEYAEINWRKAIAGFLLWLGLVGLVVLEYGAIYYAIKNAPAAQPTESEMYYRQYGGDIDDFFR